MTLSETTNNSGLVQRVEFWTRRPYGTSGDDLKEIINGLNGAFEKILPYLLAYNDQIRWDDLNHTDAPSGKFNMVANQNDYKVAVDDNSLDILNITHVRTIQATGDTNYQTLERIPSDDPRVPEILKPDTSVTGTPGAYVELGNRIYLDTLPANNVTNGIQIFFAREQQYFTVTGTSEDDTTEPGFPKPFHELLALHFALDWNAVNRSDDTWLLKWIQNRIAKMESDFQDFINLRNPGNVQITTRQRNFR